jgi:hypothetical protein
MVAGIVLFAFGLKTTLAHVGHEVALRVRVSGQAREGRLVAALACAALVPVALVVPALVALALLTAVWLALHAYELIWWRAARAETRAQRLSASTS